MKNTFVLGFFLVAAFIAGCGDDAATTKNSPISSSSASISASASASPSSSASATATATATITASPTAATVLNSHAWFFFVNSHGTDNIVYAAIRRVGTSTWYEIKNDGDPTSSLLYNTGGTLYNNTNAPDGVFELAIRLNGQSSATIYTPSGATGFPFEKGKVTNLEWKGSPTYTLYTISDASTWSMKDYLEQIFSDRGSVEPTAM